jgi:hypothetical protein
MARFEGHVGDRGVITDIRKSFVRLLCSFVAWRTLNQLNSQMPRTSFCRFKDRTGDALSRLNAPLVHESKKGGTGGQMRIDPSPI